MYNESQDRRADYDCMVSYLNGTASEEDRSTLWHVQSCPRCNLAGYAQMLHIGGRQSLGTLHLEAPVQKLPKRAAEILTTPRHIDL